MTDVQTIPYAPDNAWWPDYAADEILPGLFQGGTEDDAVVGCRAPAGHRSLSSPYDTIVTLYADALPAAWGVEEMRYGFPDSSLTPTVVGKALRLAAFAHARWTAGERVLIRCQAGVNRSGLITALVLMVDGRTAHEAIELIRERRAPAVLEQRAFRAVARHRSPRARGTDDPAPHPVRRSVDRPHCHTHPRHSRCLKEAAMHVSAHLDIDLIALDQADDVTCLIQLQAPVPPQVTARPGQTLVVVLDRSGSMSGPPLEGAKEAIAGLVRRLAPQDSFGLVVFDDQTEVVVPVAPMAEHVVVELAARIAAIQAGSSTDLSAGYLLGLREAKRSLALTGLPGATVLLVSDGHANAGIVDPVRMHDLADGASRTASITTSTLGLGLGYDEVLLEAITRGGNGSHRFAPDVDTART